MFLSNLHGIPSHFRLLSDNHFLWNVQRAFPSYVFKKNPSIFMTLHYVSKLGKKGGFFIHSNDTYKGNIIKSKATLTPLISPSPNKLDI
jgi:hypothetical protein